MNAAASSNNSLRNCIRLIGPVSARETAFFPGGVAFAWAGAPLEAQEVAVLSGLFDECLKTLGTLDAIRIPPVPPYTGPGAFTREDLARAQPPGMKIFSLTAPPASAVR